MEVGADPVGAERDRALGIAPVAGHSHAAMMGAGPGLQQMRHPAGAHQRQRGVAAALEAGRGVGREAQPAGALAHRDRIEGGGFEQQPAAAGGRLGVLAADDSRDAEDLLVVGDHHDPLVEGDRRRLEERPGALPLPGEADGDAAHDGVGVEDVGRLPQLQVGDVGGVHPGVHRLHLGREQRMQDLVGQSRPLSGTRLGITSKRVAV